VRFGYDGTSFHGWARQPGRRTVEGELLRGLVRLGVATAGEPVGLEVASRTDRGVSARANALAISSRHDAPELLRRLNAIDPHLFFTAATTVPDGFRVRAAVRRTYRYFEPTITDPDSPRLRAAALFTGRVDVRSLGRALPTGAPSWRAVESVTIRPLGGGSVIEVRAPSFVWGMVRKIVGALREVDAGRLPTERLRSALDGRTRLTLPMAEPEPLVLWDVQYEVPWSHRWPGPTRTQVALRQRERSGWWARGHVLESIGQAERVGTNGG
jgi:tRNA pseudouridine38-40 synthase